MALYQIDYVVINRLIDLQDYFFSLPSPIVKYKTIHSNSYSLLLNSNRVFFFVKCSIMRTILIRACIYVQLFQYVARIFGINAKKGFIDGHRVCFFFHFRFSSLFLLFLSSVPIFFHFIFSSSPPSSPPSPAVSPASLHVNTASLTPPAVCPRVPLVAAASITPIPFPLVLYRFEVPCHIANTLSYMAAIDHWTAQAIHVIDWILVPAAAIDEFVWFLEVDLVVLESLRRDLVTI